MEAIVIRVESDNSFAMNEIGENNDSREGDQFPKWTNLLCPSCAAYYGEKKDEEQPLSKTNNHNHKLIISES